MKKITLFEKSISQNDKFAVEDFLDNFLDRAGDNKLKVGSTIDMSGWKNIYDEDHVRDYLNTMDISFKDDVITIEGFKKVNESEENDKVADEVINNLVGRLENGINILKENGIKKSIYSEVLEKIDELSYLLVMNKYKE